MNTDIRLHVTFWGHHKTKRLKAALGSDGVESLLKLWLWTAQNRPSGVLTGMDARDIELVSDWNGPEGEFTSTCVEIKWIDNTDSKGRPFEVHDWHVWNPYAAAEDERRSQARMAKLAQANKEAYQACASTGIRELSAEEYQKLKPLHGQALADCVAGIQSAQSENTPPNSGRRAPAQRLHCGAGTPQQRRNSAADTPQQQGGYAASFPQNAQHNLPSKDFAAGLQSDFPTAGNGLEKQAESARNRPQINIKQEDAQASPYLNVSLCARSADAQRPPAGSLAPDPIPDPKERRILSPTPTDFRENRSAQDKGERGSGNGENQIPPEFRKLRAMYDEVREEAPRSGLKAYAALKNSGDWPGLERIQTALKALMEKDYQWLNGTAPGLEKFLFEGWWAREPRPSPPAVKIRRQGQNSDDGNALSRRNAETANRVLENMHSGGITQQEEVTHGNKS